MPRSTTGPGATWVLEQVIMDNAANFHSAAIAGNRLFLGDRTDQLVHVYDFDGSTWQFNDHIDDPESTMGHFGTTMSADAQALVVTDDDQVYAYDATTLAHVFDAPINGRHDYDWNDPPLYSFNDVDVDGDYFIVGDAGAPGESGYGHVFKRAGGTWANHQYLVPSTTIDSDSKIAYAVAIHDGRAIVTAPQSNDIDIRSGGAYLFALTNGTWDEVARIIPLRGEVNSGFGISATLGDHAWFGLEPYGIDDLEWDIQSIQTTSIPEYIWTGRGNGDIDHPDNWHPGVPTSGSTASMAMQTSYSAYCLDGSLPFNSLVVGPGRLILDLSNVNAEMDGNLEVAGMRSLSATIAITEGALEIDGNVDVGLDGQPGTLNIRGSSMVEVSGSYIQDELGTLSCQIETRPGAAIGVEGLLSIEGALKMTTDGSYFRSGPTSFLLLESAQLPPPGKDRFQVAIMPGLDNGSFYKLVYNDTGRGTYSISIEIETLPLDGDLADPDTLGVSGTATDLLVADLGSQRGRPGRVRRHRAHDRRHSRPALRVPQ